MRSDGDRVEIGRDGVKIGWRSGRVEIGWRSGGDRARHAEAALLGSAAPPPTAALASCDGEPRVGEGCGEADGAVFAPLSLVSTLSETRRSSLSFVRRDERPRAWA